MLVAACGGGATPPGPSPGSTSPSRTDSPAGTPVASPQRAPGASRLDDHGIEQVWVPGGVFRMGAARGSVTPPAWAANEFRGEQPQHDVTISRGFWIDTTEVTVGAFAEFSGDGGYDDEDLWSADGWQWRQRMVGKPLPAPCVQQETDEPQVCVTWFEAEAFARWRGGRLPTEAEWEFAARGPESRVYPWGDEFDPRLANLDGGTRPVAVGSYPDGASWVGALDMAGNAMEWVADWYSDTYYGEAVGVDPAGPQTGSVKVEKGGWWGPPDRAGAFVGRASYRHFEDPPSYADAHIGFRVVATD